MYRKTIIVRFSLALLLLVIGTTGFCQKLKADGYKIIFKDAHKKETRFHSKIYITYKGTLKVCSKDSLKGVYQFSYIDLGNDIGNLAFKNNQKKILPPKLLFEAKSGIFSYNNKKGEEKTFKTNIYPPLEDMVLKGMLLWLKIKQELPLK